MLVVNGLRASGAALGTPAVTTAVSLAKEHRQVGRPQPEAASHGTSGAARQSAAAAAADRISRSRILTSVSA